ACVLDNGVGRVYVDGQLVSEGYLAIPNWIVRNNNYIGKSNNGAAPPVYADLDEIRIYSVARTQAEIQSTMEQEVPLNTNGLFAYWKIDEGSGNTLIDFKSGMNATLVNNPAWKKVSAPLNVTYEWAPSAGLSSVTGRTVQATVTSVVSYSVTATNLSGCQYSDTIVVTNAIPGDTSLFGVNEWLAFAFDGTTFTDYRGYYKEGSLSFDSRDSFGSYSSPADAASYKGCAIGYDNYGVRYKRTNFNDTIYQIDISYDDEVFVYIDGVLVFTEALPGSSKVNVWTGRLTPASKVELRLVGKELETYLDVDIYPVVRPGLTAGIVATDSKVCLGNEPDVFSSVSSAVGCSQLVYQWQESLDSLTWADIVNANEETYDPPVKASTYYYRRVATDACGSISYSNVVKVEVLPLPSAPVTSTGYSCGPGSVTLKASGLGNLYRWYDAPVSGTLLHSSMDSVYVTNISTNTIFYVEIVDDNGCVSPRSFIEAQIVDMIKPEVADQVLCNSGSVILSPTGSPGTYVWYEEGSVIPLDTSLTFTTPVLNETTKYELTALDMVSGCESSKTTVTVTVDLLSDAGIISSADTICTNSIGVLTLYGYTGNIVHWEKSYDDFTTINAVLDTTSDVINADDDVRVWYRASVKNGVCPAVYSASAKIEVKQGSVGGIAKVIDTIEGDANSGTVQLIGYQGVIQHWELSDSPDFSTFEHYIPEGDTLQFRDLLTTTYFRALVKLGDCPVDTSEILEVFIEKQVLVIYQAFSPDGDGVNDQWIIEGIETYPDCEVTIFNRWGDIVYQQSGYNNREKVWDGKSNRQTIGSNELPEGTYFYKIQIQGKEFAGYVVLKRKH
ncbi:MAG TPA: gliding motility-associated C-terminal domain-containing protein, partial [Cytophagaceae bacterium]